MKVDFAIHYPFNIAEAKFGELTKLFEKRIGAKAREELEKKRALEQQACELPAVEKQIEEEEERERESRSGIMVL